MSPILGLGWSLGGVIAGHPKVPGLLPFGPFD